MGFVRKLLFASVLQLKTTCRELNGLPSFRNFSINLFLYKIPTTIRIERPTDRSFKYKLKHSSSIYVQPCICIDANFFANVNCKTFRFLLVMYDCETRLVHYCLWCGEVVRESFSTMGESFSGLSSWIVVLKVELNQRRADDKSEIARLCKYTHFISNLLVEILMPFDAAQFVKAGEFTCST